MRGGCASSPGAHVTLVYQLFLPLSTPQVIIFIKYVSFTRYLQDVVSPNGWAYAGRGTTTPRYTGITIII